MASPNMKAINSRLFPERIPNIEALTSEYYARALKRTSRWYRSKRTKQVPPFHIAEMAAAILAMETKNQAKTS